MSLFTQNGEYYTISRMETANYTPALTASYMQQEYKDKTRHNSRGLCLHNAPMTNPRAEDTFINTLNQLKAIATLKFFEYKDIKAFPMFIHDIPNRSLHLTHVMFEECALDPLVINPFFRYMKDDTKITHLTFRKNAMSSSSELVMAGMLAVNTGLISLSMIDEHFGCCGFNNVLNGLTHNTTLRHLRIKNCSNYWEPTKDFAATLLKLDKLVTLKLKNALCRQRDSFPEVFGSYLLINPNLQALSLPYDYLREKDFEGIAGALETNTTLKKLDLRDNHFSVKCRQLLLSALIRNGTSSALQRLVIPEIRFYDAYGDLMIDLITNHKNLIRIKCGSISITKPEEIRLREAALRSYRLEKFPEFTRWNSLDSPRIIEAVQSRNMDNNDRRNSTLAQKAFNLFIVVVRDKKMRMKQHVALAKQRRLA